MEPLRISFNVARAHASARARVTRRREQRQTQQHIINKVKKNILFNMVEERFRLPPGKPFFT